ncbi:MAG: T9SS type A sorting domain-containing protein, partial [Bacteroidota bacterium]
GNAFIEDYLDWDYLVGDQGSMVSTWQVETNLTDLYPYSYYEDDTTPETQQCTGDRTAYASAGNVYITGTPENGGMPWTDPSNPASYNSQGKLRFLRLARSIVPEVPNLPEADAQSTVTQLSTPIVFSVREVDVTGGGDVLAPQINGSYSGTSFLGTASDGRPNDTGLATLALSPAATNLALATDSFTEGDATTSFTVTPIDPQVTGSGYVIATDVAGNADSVFVSLDAVVVPFDLAAAATYAFTNATEGTITVTASNIGADPLTSVRVVRSSTAGLAVAQKTITLGALAPGEAKDAVFSFSNATAGATASFQVQDLVVREGESDVSNNDVTVTLDSESDVAAPTLAGSAAGTVWTGTASDSDSNDSGIATVTLAGDATNLTLTVSPFTLGDPQVSLSVELTDAAQPGAGTVVATDIAGNTGTLFLELSPVSGDTAPPILAGSYGASTFEGTARDDRPADTGLASITLRDAVNLRLTVVGDLPGAPSASFRVQPITRKPGRGTLVAIDVAGNESTLFIATDLAGQRATNEGAVNDEVAATDERSDAKEGMFMDAEPDAMRDAMPNEDTGTEPRPPNETAQSGKPTDTRVVDAEVAGKPVSDAGTPSSDDVKDERASTSLTGDKEAVAASVEGESSPETKSPAEADEAVPADAPVAGAASAGVEPVSPFVVEVYPNPLRGVATLRLYLRSESPVRVALYDLTGRRVAIVVDRRLGAGWHGLALDAHALTSGLYLWRAETGFGVETGHLSVVR